MSLFAVSNLDIAFGDVAATRGVTFELRRGQVLALVGESGSGKSVTAMAVLGLLPGTATVTGSVELDGEELLGAPPDRLRELRGGQIGTIFQEPMTAWNPVFTIGNQIEEAIRAHRALSRSAVRARVRELLATVGLTDVDRVVRSYPHELSGGQLQRAMIAMAISCDPMLLIADEPTTALDVTVQAGILDLLRDLRDRLGMAILLITHDMGVVADLADAAVVLRRGSIVESASVPSLFAAPAQEYTRELLSAVPTIRPGSSSPPAAPVASLRDVVVEYRGRRHVRALDGVSLEITRGQVLGLVGESGSGKSTAGRALAGLVPVAAGTVLVNGTDLGTVSRRGMRDLRADIGIVFQDPASSLNPRRTVADSIAEPLVVHRSLTPAQQQERVNELLSAVQLGPEFRARFPYEMSGGQRQRVAIARALALNPALLIADEPTSGLDVSVQARILDLIESLQEQFGFGCLFISHDLAVVGRLADRVAVMHQGRIVEEGPPSSVLLAPSDPYTQRLLAAAPVADPVEQASRRASRSAP
ncbi:dipeptide ABC transporter ATP-binding protein [Actinoplanes sp. NPDC051343]|uniref:dipeptide ABC transporter ATP-binding protein n=1 Tax=Actinoplanes sp. NPDC051343 TaxID=3363906 RepID=UPI00379164D9